MEWVSVNDRLPDKEGVYLVCTSEMGNGKPLVIAAWWSIQNKCFERLPWTISDAVTHWIPMPQPPTKENDNAAVA